MFSKLKTLLRKADERAVEAAWKRIGYLLDCFIPEGCSSYLVNSGYAPTRSNHALGSGLVDQSQKMTVAASAMA